MGENKGRINAPAVSRVNKSALVRACDEGKKYAGKLICAHTLFLNSAVPFIMISVFLFVFFAFKQHHQQKTMNLRGK